MLPVVIYDTVPTLRTGNVEKAGVIQVRFMRLALCSEDAAEGRLVRRFSV